jgi:uncharacterized protein YdcH (DUF465 family)
MNNVSMIIRKLNKILLLLDSNPSSDLIKQAEEDKVTISTLKKQNATLKGEITKLKNNK